MASRTWLLRVAGSMALVTLAGCVRSRVTQFDPTLETEARTPAEQIKFFGEHRPRCPYKEIGSVSTESRFLASWSSVVREAREKAYEIGGDAIVGVNHRTRISGVVVSENGGSTTETTAFTGTVIRYSRLDCRE
jgi:hypothetical protein